jgi:hypothetical protein
LKTKQTTTALAKLIIRGEKNNILRDNDALSLL